MSPAPGTIDNLDGLSLGHSSPRSTTRSDSELAVDKSPPIVVGLFGSDGGDNLKNRLFLTLCGEGSPLKGSNSGSIQRGYLLRNNSGGRQIQVWKFPSLHEGTWLQKAEAFLCVTGYLKSCIGGLHGVIYVLGTDDDLDDDAFRLFQSLIGNDELKRSLILSSETIEPVGGPEDLEIPKTVLSSTSYDACAQVLELFLEPSRIPQALLFQQEISGSKSLGSTTAGILFEKRLKAAKQILESALDHIYGRPISPQTPPQRPPEPSPPRRRPTSTALTNELNEARQRLSELQQAHAALDHNLSDRIHQLEALNEELRLENRSLHSESEILKAELDELRLKNTQKQVDTQDFCGQTDPLPEAKPTREDLQNEVLDLKNRLADAKLDEAKAAKRIAELSDELAKARLPLADAQKANTELKKRIVSLEKQTESLTKTADTKRQEVDKAKAEMSKLNLQLKSTNDDLKKAQQELNDHATSRAKLEDERAKAINVSEGLLKVKDGVEKQLAEAKAQVDAEKERRKVEIQSLKDKLVERDAQVQKIAHAAEAWKMASIEANSLKEELQLVQAHTDATQREMHNDIMRMRADHERASNEWELERDKLNASILSLTRSNEASRDDLEALVRQRDSESQGYISRISELERWGEKRWDAVGDSCIIA